VYVAVYVVALEGAVTSWVWAPPSDQDTQLHLPRSCCGDGALRVFRDPTMAVRLNGVGAAVLLNPSVIPDGCDFRVSVVVCGRSTTPFDAMRPFESVAVSVTSSEAGYSWSGATKEPFATPLKVWSGWS
jgi:hypothetical protein